MKDQPSNVIYPAHYTLFDFAISHNLEKIAFTIWDLALKFKTIFSNKRVVAYTEFVTRLIDEGEHKGNGPLLQINNSCL
jgi:hypothetical protein